jgi:hypothetical protein
MRKTQKEFHEVETSGKSSNEEARPSILTEAEAEVMTGKLCGDFLRRFRYTDSWGKPRRYYPERNSSAWRKKYHRYFTVIYSIPDRGNTVVASVRAKPKSGGKEKEILHFDATTLFDAVFDYYLPQTHERLPKQ